MKCWGVERRKRVVEQKERLEAERETHVDYSHVELRYDTPGLFHEALFDPSMMVHFRKRFPVNEVAQINEYLCTGKRPDGMRDVDRNKTSEQDEEEGDVKSQDDDNHLPPASINEDAKESSGKKKGKHRNCTSKKKEKRKRRTEQTSWSNFNESLDLQEAVENYFRREGVYPSAVLADQIYQTRANKKFCKEKGIRRSGLPLGRRKKSDTDAKLKRQMYKDSCQRNAIEGCNGTAKRRFGLDRIMSKLDETSKTEVALIILAMNASYRLVQWLALIFSFRFFGGGQKTVFQ